MRLNLKERWRSLWRRAPPVVEVKAIADDRELIDLRARLAREAGTAEIATGVLRDVGGALDGVTATASALRETIYGNKLHQALDRVVSMLSDPKGDPDGARLASFLAELSRQSIRDRDRQIDEMHALAQGIDHIQRIVAAQHRHAAGSGKVERCRLDQLAQDALRLQAPALKEHQVEVTALLQPIEIDADPGRVLRILVDLVGRAIQSMDERPQGRRLSLRTSRTEAGAMLAVEDNGPRIASAAEGLLRDGGEAAREMGGTLAGRNREDGPGARFSLTLPLAGRRRRAAEPEPVQGPSAAAA